MSGGSKAEAAPIVEKFYSLTMLNHWVTIVWRTNEPKRIFGTGGA